MRAPRRPLRRTVRTTRPNAVMRSCIATELVPNQTLSGAEGLRHCREVRSLSCTAGNDGGLTGLWRGAVQRPSDPDRPYSSHHRNRHDGRPHLPCQPWHLLPNPHAQRSSRLGLLVLRPLPEPKNGPRRIIAVGDSLGRGQSRHLRRLVCGHTGRGRSPVTPPPALGAGQSQHGLRSASASEPLS